MRTRALFLSLLSLSLAATVLAAPTIQFVTPTRGPATGGTVVQIDGTGFSTCVICSPPTPPEVFFGGVPAADVQLVGPTRIIATTPPHPAATVTVTVVQPDGSSSVANAFTFEGNFLAALERVLIPVFSPPVRGAFGSEFVTTVVAAHEGVGPRALLYGLDTSCLMITPVLGPENARLIEPNGLVHNLTPDCASWPAKFFYVTREQAGNVTFNARVRDVSRSALSHGTEIPIVRESDFRQDQIVLLSVPIEARFRNTLRIYSPDAANVLVTVDQREHIVSLQSGRNPYEPSYAMFTDFPLPEANGPTRIRVKVAPLTPITSPPSPTPRIWAFISVTNNTTQEITTITPD